MIPGLSWSEARRMDAKRELVKRGWQVGCALLAVVLLSLRCS